MNTVVVIAAVIATLATVAWFLFARKFPERSASHSDRSPIGANTRRSVSRDVAERPAGPDAESMDASRPGGSTPPPPPPEDDEPRRRPIDRPEDTT